MDATLLASWCTGVSPPNTAAIAAPVARLPAFDPAEEAILSSAVPRRRDEYRTGRECARRALAELECPRQGIPADSRRLPDWPAGFVGSISHGAGLCIAQIARTRDFLGVGVDVEAADAVLPDLLDVVASPDEWLALRRGGPGDRVAATLCFSAKEAFYKAYFPCTDVLLGFHDVRIEADWSCGRFDATLVAPDKPGLHGRRSWSGHFLLGGPVLATTLLIERAPQAGVALPPGPLAGRVVQD